MADIKTGPAAYAEALKQAQNPGGRQQTPGVTEDGVSFSDVLKSKVEGAIEAQHHSERVSMAAAAGQADMTELLQAVTDAETTLNMVVAIRDRVVQSYQELMRMPV